MVERRKLRFSLRSFLIFCLVASLLTGFVISRYLSHDRWLNSIDVHHIDNPAVHNWGKSHDFISFQRELSYRGQPICYRLFVYDFFDPNVPASKLEVRHSSWEGEMLTIDDELVNPANGPFLYVNGAYGYTVKIHLEPGDLEALEALWSSRHLSPQPLLDYWRTEVEPRLYKLTGNSINGQRDGKWTYELWNGSLYLEAEYRLGDREG
jgi:hypothetical protein